MFTNQTINNLTTHRDNFIELCVLSPSIPAFRASDLPATAPQYLADTAPQRVFKFACAVNDRQLHVTAHCVSFDLNPRDFAGR